MTSERVKPGRELDALVAEKVMGLAVWYEDDDEDKKFPATDDPYNPEVPAYSTDIAAAWEVVGHLRNDHWVVHVVLTDEGVSAKLGDSYWVPEVFADSETAPHAICLAALRAVGVEVDDG